VKGEKLSDWLRSRPPAAERRAVARRLAHLVRRMHDAGFSHRDLKAPNLLVSPAHGEAARPVLVDLDGLAYKGYVSEGRRAKDLMRLSVSLEEWGVARATDRLRFLRAYLAPAGAPAPMTTRARRHGDPSTRSGSPRAGSRGDTEPGRELARWWRRVARLSIRKWAMLQRKTQER
ncbi:MAG: lipopolysaccharide kinase InaA family protein, partial [Phycisphaerae bacterium]